MSQPSNSALRTALEDLRPNATVLDVSPAAAGKNAVYEVSFDDRDAILKVGTASGDRVLVEPEIVRFVRERTAVPVPEVLGASEDRLEHPCCLYERVPGRTVPDRPTIGSPDLLGRICEEAGRNLADLHDIDAFEQCGPLVLEDGELAPADTGEDWPSGFQRVLEAKIDRLGPQFQPHLDALREYAGEAATACRQTAPVTPVVAHMDYRPANLVLDTDAERVTRAVLDWAGASVTPAAYELAHAEALLTDWPDATVDQEALRERFRSGYAQQRELPEIPDVYRVDARLRLVKHLDVETGDLDEAAVEARVEDHLASLEALGAI